MILDIFSRYVVGWMLALQESARLAKLLIAATCTKQEIVAGQLTVHADRGTSMRSQGVAVLLGISWAVLVTRLAIAMARTRPEHDPDDPRYVLQGHVAVVTVAIPAGGEGRIEYGDTESRRTLRARSIDEHAIDAGLEVCIERVDGDLASVELWAQVEARL